jgi:hypothetical protein
VIDPALCAVAAVTNLQNTDIRSPDRSAGCRFNHDVRHVMADEVRPALPTARESCESVAPLVSPAARTLIGSSERRIRRVEVCVGEAIVGPAVERIAVPIDQLLDLEIVEHSQHCRRRRRLLRRCSTEAQNDRSEDRGGDDASPRHVSEPPPLEGDEGFLQTE